MVFPEPRQRHPVSKRITPGPLGRQPTLDAVCLHTAQALTISSLPAQAAFVRQANQAVLDPRRTVDPRIDWWYSEFLLAR
jgi:hypothetical protein